MTPEATEGFIGKVFVDLRKVGANHWVAGGHEAVSYGEQLHDENAAYEEMSFWFRQRNTVFLDVLKAFGATPPLVDIGGGTGIVGRFLCDHGFPTINLEPTESGARQAMLRHVPTIVSTLQKAGVRPDSLPAVGMFDVLEHIDDDADALAAIASALRPGGHFLVSVPAHEWLWSLEDATAGHFRRYDRGSLGRLLRKAGLEPVYVTHMFSYLTAPLFAMRTIPTLWGRVGRKDRENKQGIHVPPTFVSRTLGILGTIERNWIAKRRVLPVGTSLLAVARKPSR